MPLIRVVTGINRRAGISRDRIRRLFPGSRWPRQRNRGLCWEYARPPRGINQFPELVLLDNRPAQKLCQGCRTNQTVRLNEMRATSWLPRRKDSSTRSGRRVKGRKHGKRSRPFREGSMVASRHGLVAAAIGAARDRRGKRLHRGGWNSGRSFAATRGRAARRRTTGARRGAAAIPAATGRQQCPYQGQSYTDMAQQHEQLSSGPWRPTAGACHRHSDNQFRAATPSRHVPVPAWLAAHNGKLMVNDREEAVMGTVALPLLRWPTTNVDLIPGYGGAVGYSTAVVLSFTFHAREMSACMVCAG